MTYNLAGELLTESYAGGGLNGLSITNGYDALLRRTNLTARASSVLSRTTYGYDAASRLATVRDTTKAIPTLRIHLWCDTYESAAVITLSRRCSA